MRFLKFTLMVLLAGLLWAPVTVGHAHAAGDPPADSSVSEPGSAADGQMLHGLACADGICSLSIDLGDAAPAWLPASGLVLTVLQDNLHILPDGAGFSVSDELTLDMPVGDLKLADANIELTTGDHGRVESFYGTATIPAPSFGVLGPSPRGKPLSASIGFDRASQLPAVDAPLDPERKYLFIDLAAGAELATDLGEGIDGDLWLSIPQGQRATVVIDPQERFAFIDGNVSLRYSGTLAFLTQLIDPMESVDLWNGELPLRHQATVHVSGVVADDMQDTRLELEGRYAVDGGKVAEWLKLDDDPLAIEGGIVVNDEGVLGTGLVRSTLLSEKVLDGAIQAQVFIPFSSEYEKAYVALNTRLEIPFADVAADGYARIDGGLELVADASFETPWRAEDTEIAVNDQSELEAIGFGDEVEGPDRWTKVWDATTNVARSGYEGARAPARTGYAWLKDQAKSGYESAATGVEWSIDLASRQWCSTTGICQAEDTTATAMR